jgi:hypothetical protein
MASTLIILNNNLKSKSQISLSNPTNSSSSPISDSNSSSISNSTVTTPTSGIDSGTTTNSDNSSSQLTNSYQSSTARKFSNSIPPIPSSAPVVTSNTPSATPITKVINNTFPSSKNNLNNSIVTIINKNALNSNIHEALNNNSSNISSKNFPSLTNNLNELTNNQKLYISTHHFKLTKSSSQDFIERNVENTEKQQLRIKSCLASISGSAPTKNYRSLPKSNIDSDDSDDKNDEQEIAKIEDEKQKLDPNSNTSSDASSISDTLMPSSSSSSAVSSGTSSPSASPTTTSKATESTSIDITCEQNANNLTANPKKIKFSSFISGEIQHNNSNNIVINKNENLIQVEQKEEEIDVSKSIETINLKEQIITNSDFCIISTKQTASESVPSSLSSKSANSSGPIVKTKKRVSFNDSLVQVHLIPNISSFLNVEKYNFNISSSMTTETSIPSSEDEENETNMTKMTHSINTMINTNNNHRIQPTEFYFESKDLNTITSNFNDSNFLISENNNSEKEVMELNEANSSLLIVEPPSDILLNNNQQNSNDINYDASSLSSTTSSASSSSSLSTNNNNNNNINNIINNNDQQYSKTVFNDENQTNYISNNLNNKRYRNYLRYQKNILLESNNELNNNQNNNNNSNNINSVTSNSNNNNNQQVFVFKASTNLKNSSPQLQSQTNNYLNNNLSIIGNSKVIPKQQSILQLNNSKNSNFNSNNNNYKKINPNYSQIFLNKRSLTNLSPTSLSNNQNSSSTHPFILYDANTSSSNGDFLNTKQIPTNNQNLHYLRQFKTRNSSNPPSLNSSYSTQTSQLSEFYAPNTVNSSTTNSGRSNSNSQKDVHPQLKFISNLKKLKPSSQSNQILQNEYIPLIMETNLNKHHEPSNHYHKMMSDFQQEKQYQSQKSTNNSTNHTKYIFLKPDEQLYHSTPLHNSTFNTRSHTIANINLDSKTNKKDLKSEIKELVENSNLNTNNNSKTYDLSTLNQLVTLKDINYYLKNNGKYASANNTSNNKNNRLNSNINNSNNFIHVNQNRNYPNLRQNVNNSNSNSNQASIKPRTEINLMKLNAQINPDIVDSKRSTSALPLLRRQFSKKMNNFINESSTINENNEYNLHNSNLNGENMEQLTNNLNNLTKNFTNNQNSVPFTYKLFNSKMVNNLTRAKTFMCTQATNNVSSFIAEKSNHKSSRCTSIDKTSL